MSKKRMFSQSIVESDVFLDMPLSAQSLYFHLSMNADDYGFVSPKRIMRMIAANDDDLKILILKRYVLSFDSGVVVIKHWQLNNTVRKDRSTPTTYQLEMASLAVNDFGAYTEKWSANQTRAEIGQIMTKIENTTDFPELVVEMSQGSEPKSQPKANQMSPQIRLDKIRLGNTTNVVLAKTPSADIDEMFEIWVNKTGIAIQSNTKKNRYACSNLLKKHGRAKTEQLITGVVAAQEDRYAPRIYDFVSLQSKLNELLLWGRKRNHSGVEIIS